MMMNKYTKHIFWSDKDESYIVNAPDLKGCMADGKTEEEAIRNANIAINDWILTAEEMGWIIPEPKNMKREDILNKLYSKYSSNPTLDQKLNILIQTLGDCNIYYNGLAEDSEEYKIKKVSVLELEYLEKGNHE
jgi:predicted RNase H-like HicB family nuclease